MGLFFVRIRQKNISIAMTTVIFINEVPVEKKQFICDISWSIWY